MEKEARAKAEAKAEAKAKADASQRQKKLIPNRMVSQTRKTKTHRSKSLTPKRLVNRTRQREENAFNKEVKQSNTYKKMMSNYRYLHTVNNVALGETPVKPARYSHVPPRSTCASCAITRRRR